MAEAKEQTEQAAKEGRKKFSEYVVEEGRKGNVVFASLDDYGVAPLDEFIKQPADGILYDLDRLPEVVLTFIDDRKWVNDYAVYQVIKRLRELMPEWQPIETAPLRKWILLFLPQTPTTHDKTIFQSVGMLVDRGWWLSAGGGAGGLLDEKGCQPTHWMPLPDPPKG